MLIHCISWFYRRLPIKSGLTKLSFNPVVNRLMRHLDHPMTARLADGNTITVDPLDYHGRILYLFGTNDIKVSMNAVAFLLPGDVFLDIGANYSTIGFAASHIVGPAGAVHLFEPQRKLCDWVEEAICAGGYTNVHLHRNGLMDEDAILPIIAPTHHSGRATFVEHEDTSGFSVIDECEVREIGAYVGPLVAGRRFAAKLDIEGAEPKVMPWLLAQPNMRFLIFEAAHNHQILHDQILAAGMTLYGLERDPFRLRISRVDDIAGMARFHDLMALRLPPDMVLPAHVDPRKLAARLAGSVEEYA